MALSDSEKAAQQANKIIGFMRAYDAGAIAASRVSGIYSAPLFKPFRLTCGASSAAPSCFTNARKTARAMIDALEIFTARQWGRKAKEAGLPASSNPYRSYRSRLAWLDGYGAIAKAA